MSNIRARAKSGQAPIMGVYSGTRYIIDDKVREYPPEIYEQYKSVLYKERKKGDQVIDQVSDLNDPNNDPINNEVEDTTHGE